MNERLLILVLILLAALIYIIPHSPQKKESIPSPIEQAPTYSEDLIYTSARRRMVEEDLASRDIVDPKVLAVMGRLPRHLFVPEKLRGQAYVDSPLPIGFGQTISQPYIVALMTQSINPQSSDRVLEVGTGSGYQAAVLSEIVSEVYTIEIIPELAYRANETLRGLGYENVHVLNADGYFGLSEHAPYDAVVVTAAVDHIPPYLVEQLVGGGRLILPLGSTKYFQTLTLVTKGRDGELTTQYITGVRFVPLTGEAERRSAL